MEDNLASDQNEPETGAIFRLELSLGHLLHRAQQVAADRFVATAADGEDGLTLRQAIMLAAIAERQGCSQADLVRATGIDRSTVAEMVQRLEKNGLIARERNDSDNRAKTVALTDDGASVLARAAPRMAQADAELIGLLPKNRRSAIIAALGLIVGSGAITPAPAPPPEPHIALNDNTDGEPLKLGKKDKKKDKKHKAEKKKKKHR